jgi:hypothetical protein
LRDLQRCPGFDLGVDVDHITTNIRPNQSGASIDFLPADEVMRIEDADTGAVLFVPL